MTQGGFEADLSEIRRISTTLLASADSLNVDLTVSGDMGPGRLGPAVAALLASAGRDLTRARDTVDELSTKVDEVRSTYADLDTDVASRFDQGSW